MYHHMSLQVVQSVKLATADLAIELLIRIMIFLVHTQVSYMVEGLLTYVTGIFALVIRHVRFFVFR